jgi:hypothetical protein
MVTVQGTPLILMAPVAADTVALHSATVPLDEYVAQVSNVLNVAWSLRNG